MVPDDRAFGEDSGARVLSGKKRMRNAGNGPHAVNDEWNWGPVPIRSPRCFNSHSVGQSEIGPSAAVRLEPHLACCEMPGNRHHSHLSRTIS